ncbi:hypothetical protein IscW_ISCW002367, partial [Ixodes scapularis]
TETGRHVRDAAGDDHERWTQDAVAEHGHPHLPESRVAGVARRQRGHLRARARPQLWRI